MTEEGTRSRLSLSTLGMLPKSVALPAYDRSALKTGIVHVGIGAFHRAHQAAYVDDLLAADPNWAITGVDMLGPEVRDALKPQDMLYTHSARSGEGERLRIIGSIVDLIVAAEERERLLATMADPKVRIVSTTVTEKGYCHDPATGELNEAHPGIVQDLKNPHAPGTAPGLIVEALARRRAAGVAPFTMMACDNLPSNGVVARRVFIQFAKLRDADLGAWVEGEIAFPSTMVDRITPATTDEDRERVSAQLGLTDAWPVVTEPFTQWVIEDNFALGRPAYEAAGAEMVADVEPYELMKLRLLNGAHSSLSYLGYLAGYPFVSDVMADATFARYVAALMEEATPSLDVPMDLTAYKAALVERFRNPALKHRTWQICMDGTQKLPQRLLGTIRDNLKSGAPFGRLALGVAAWMRYVMGTDEQGKPIDVRDPLAGQLRALADAAGPSAERLAHAFLGVEKVFGADLAADPRFVAAVTERLARLLADGAKHAVAVEEGIANS